MGIQSRCEGMIPAMRLQLHVGWHPMDAALTTPVGQQVRLCIMQPQTELVQCNLVCDLPHHTVLRCGDDPMLL